MTESMRGWVRSWDLDADLDKLDEVRACNRDKCLLYIFLQPVIESVILRRLV